MMLYTILDLLTMVGCLFMFIYGLVQHMIPLIVVGAVGYFVYPLIYEPLYNTISNLTFNEQKYAAHLRRQATSFENLPVPIIYHPRYNVTACGIEKCHPFDAQKYGKVFAHLKNKGIIKSARDIHEPSAISRSTLLRVQTKMYLFKLCYSYYIFRVVEVPVCILPEAILRWRVLEPMLYATQGSIDGGIMALTKGWAINLSGGYHHACGESGSGFCVYADITLCIKHLQKYFPEKVTRAMIIDLDAHQGNGHERDFIGDESVFIIDAYNDHIFPGDGYARRAIKVNIALKHGERDETYLNLLKDQIPEAIDAFKPDFILYNAGTDCLAGDPLGHLEISAEGIVKRDEFIFELAFGRHIPILMVLSGGYQQTNADIIATSIVNLNHKLDLLKSGFNDDWFLQVDSLKTN